MMFGIVSLPSPSICGLKKTVMRDVHLVQNTRVERVGLTERQVVRVKSVRKGDWSFCCERTSTELIHMSKSGNVGHEAEPVLRTEIMVHSPIVRVLRVRLGVREGKTTHRIRKSIIPVTG